MSDPIVWLILLLVSIPIFMGLWAVARGLSGAHRTGLVSCPACSKQVSASAATCPGCGQAIARGFFGASGPERAINLGCLFMLVIGIPCLIILVVVLANSL